METNSGLLLLYEIKAIAGPLIGPLFMSLAGNWALFTCIGTVYALFSAIAIYRKQVGPQESPDAEDYVAVPRTSPAIFELDPRTDEETETESEQQTS